MPSSQLLQMSVDYTTNGVGTLACDQGRDVVYPECAPGFVYDPTGYLLTLPGRQVWCCSDAADESQMMANSSNVYIAWGSERKVPMISRPCCLDHISSVVC